MPSMSDDAPIFSTSGTPPRCSRPLYRTLSRRSCSLVCVYLCCWAAAAGTVVAEGPSCYICGGYYVPPSLLKGSAADGADGEPSKELSSPLSAAGAAGARYLGRRTAPDWLQAELKSIGSTTSILAEASDALGNPKFLLDGQSGDVDFPFGGFQPILTIGEFDAESCHLPTGKPDGQGVYLPSLDTVRLVYQSENVGNPTYYFSVNGGAAHFTASHVHYIDYNRAMLKELLAFGRPVASSVQGSGHMITTAYNLAGNLIDSNANVHYGDSAADGTFVTRGAANKDVWVYHSLCSAHLEEAHQWGVGIGLEDSTFVTNEEWTKVDPSLVASNGYVGLSAHAIDLATRTAYAVGAFGMGGFEKIVEFNCGVNGYVCFAVSGYNGNFGAENVASAFVARREAVAPTRSDGTAWVYPQNIVPARIYIGAKGYRADGSPCGDSCDFLSRNGLSHGVTYGFAVPARAPDRDEWHKGNDREKSPGKIAEGFFAPTGWKWDGIVRDFEHDQAWDFQEPPAMPDGGIKYKFWTAAGRDDSGAKTEHNSPDPRMNARFIQGSTAGYMGIYDMTEGNSIDPRSISDVLSGLSNGELPEFIPAGYELVEGETQVSDRINLGGKGLRADGGDQTTMVDHKGEEKETLEDVDGLEWFAAADGKDYVIVQEDGGNVFGERLFMFQMPGAGVKPSYYFLAMAGGRRNSRANAAVCVPAGTSVGAASAEFSGASDMSGVLNQKELGGYARRKTEAAVSINDKVIAVGLQFGLCQNGIISACGLDRGGQIYAFKPNLDQTS